MRPRKFKAVKPHTHAPWLMLLAFAALTWSLALYLLSMTPLSLHLLLPRGLSRCPIGPLTAWDVMRAKILHAAFGSLGPTVLVAGVGALAVCVAARRCPHRAWQFIYGAVYGAALPILPVLLGFPRLLWTASIPWLFFQWCCWAAGGGVFVLVASLVRDWLFGCRVVLDATHCPGCGYDISHSPADRCSECGTAVVPDAQCPAPWRRRAWCISAAWTGIFLASLVATYAVLPYVLVPMYIAKGGLRNAPSPWTPGERIDYLLDLNPWQANRLIAQYLRGGTLQERRVAASIASYRDCLRLGHYEDCLTLKDPSIPICQVGRAASLDLLHAAIEDPDPQVRRDAARTFFLRGQPDLVVAHFGELREHPDEDVRQFVERDGVETVISALYDADIQVRQAAYDTLPELGADFAYRADAPETERIMSIRRAHEWWRNRQAERE